MVHKMEEERMDLALVMEGQPEPEGGQASRKQKGIEGHSQVWENPDKYLTSVRVGSPELVLKPIRPQVASTDQLESIVQC